MGLEAGTYLADLVPANPDGADGKSEGDNHIRLMKLVLQNTFPGMAGRVWRNQTKSSGYTVVLNDNMTVFNLTAVLTLSLTAAATLGDGHLFMLHANGGDVTIDPNASETINGGTTIVVPDGFCAIVVCNGTSFKAFIIPTVAPFTTGDVKLTYKTAADAGWVMMNDGTIGNAVSGGTTRANADTVYLFTLLWNNTADAQCAVSGGRGASAAADFAANKTIALPKALGRALASAGAGAGLTSRVLALASGTETKTIGTTNLPASGLSIPGLSIPALTGTAAAQDVMVGTGSLSGIGLVEQASTGPIVQRSGRTVASSVTTNTSTTGGGTTGNMGSGTALDVMNPMQFLNVMIKL